MKIYVVSFFERNGFSRAISAFLQKPQADAYVLECMKVTGYGSEGVTADKHGNTWFTRCGKHNWKVEEITLAAPSQPTQE